MEVRHLLEPIEGARPPIRSQGSRRCRCRRRGGRNGRCGPDRRGWHRHGHRSRCVGSGLRLRWRREHRHRGGLRCRHGVGGTCDQCRACEDGRHRGDPPGNRTRTRARNDAGAHARARGRSDTRRFAWGTPTNADRRNGTHGDGELAEIESRKIDRGRKLHRTLEGGENTAKRRS